MAKKQTEKTETEVRVETSDSKVINSIVKKINAAKGGEDGYRVLSLDNTECTDFISTGNFATNFAISGRPITGGLPVGRVSEIYGEEASGKTLLSTMCMIETQRRNGIAILLDTEHSFYPDFFVAQGGIRESLIEGTPDTLEAVWDEISQLVDIVRAECPDKYITIVWDSVSSSSPKNEKDKGMASHEMGERAKINSKGLRKLTGKLAKNKIALICINQVREKIGIMFGNNETTSGGRAFRFHASVRIRTAKRKSSLDKRKAIAARMAVIKNKVYLPYASAEYVIDYNRGVNPASGFLQCLQENELVFHPTSEKGKESKGWYQIKGTDIKFQKNSAVSTFHQILESNFKGCECILGKDIDRINTPEFKENVQYMLQKLALFTDADSEMEGDGMGEKVETEE